MSHQNHTPQEFVTELRGLSELNWRDVLYYYTQQPELDAWYAQFNWERTSSEGAFRVRTATGGELALTVTSGKPLSGNWFNVREVDYRVWGVEAGTAEDNPAVIERAAQVWPTYLAAARSVLGEPTWEGCWDSENFPDRPRGSILTDPMIRLEEKDPYRMAYWLPESGIGPFVIMRATLAVGTAHDVWGGGANLSMTFRSPPMDRGSAAGPVDDRHPGTSFFTAAWTDWAEQTSEDGAYLARTQLGIRISTSVWGRKTASVCLNRLTYNRTGGVPRLESPRFFQGQAGGWHEKAEVVRASGEVVGRVHFHSPGQAHKDIIRFSGAMELDDGDYIVRVPEGARTTWTIEGKPTVYVTVPLPQHEIAFTIEGSASASARPAPKPPVYVDPDDDPYQPSPW